VLVAASVLWVLSLGPTLSYEGRKIPPDIAWLPMTALTELPGFSGVRAPNRASFLVAPLLVVGAVVFIERLRRGGSRQVWFASLAIGALLATASVRQPNGISEGSPPHLETALEEMADDPVPGTVLHLPDDCLSTIWEVEFQVVHGRELVGC